MDFVVFLIYTAHDSLVIDFFPAWPAAIAPVFLNPTTLNTKAVRVMVAELRTSHQSHARARMQAWSLVDGKEGSSLFSLE